jgi:glycosyltransferase involved in cell wall biosynthesis
MRILLVSNQFIPVVGGIENFLRDFVPALRDRGAEVAVLTSTHAVASDAVGEHAGVPVFRSDLQRSLAARDVGRVHRDRRRIEEIVREWDPDVVHAHDIGPNLWAHLRTRAAHRAPTLLTIQTSMPGILEPASLPTAVRIVEDCDWVTGVSTAVLDEVRALVPSIAESSSVVHNAVTVPPDPPVAPPREPRVLCLGRLVLQKGIDVAVASMPRLIARVPAAMMTIAGDGVERARLERLAGALGVDSRIRFIGIVRHRDVASVLDATSVVAMPSRFEGLPLVWLESALRARPVVSTAAHGLAELVDDGRTGVVVPVDDPTALADALANLLLDPDGARVLGSAARELVVERFSMSACVDAYLAIYERIAEGRSAVGIR